MEFSRRDSRESKMYDAIECDDDNSTVSLSTQVGTGTQGGVGFTQGYGDFIQKSRREGGGSVSDSGRLVSVKVGDCYSHACFCLLSEIRWGRSCGV